MSPVPLCLEKWGVMTPPAPMGAPPLAVLHHIRSVKIWNDFHCALFKLYFYFITANINKKQNQ